MNEYTTQNKLGTYRLGLTNVDVYTLPQLSGGEFYFCPDGDSLPRVKIGLKFDYWGEVVNVALHESMEYLLAQHQLRFAPSAKFNDDPANYLFVFDHTQFADVCARQAVFIAEVLPALARAWKAARKEAAK